jgi:3D (Asp-Asp-Asp) domain-containing protein
MSKLKKIPLLIFLILFLVSSTASAFTSASKQVFVTEGDATREYITTQTTFKAFLESENIIINEHDIINVDLYAKLDKESPNYVNIARAIDVVVIKDLNKMVISAPHNMTTSEFIRMLERESGQTYIANQYYTEELIYVDEIILETITTQEFVITAKVPFATDYVYNDELLHGSQRVYSNGEYGQKEVVVSATFVGGIEQNREVLHEEQIIIPTNKIIAVGTGELKETQKPPRLSDFTSSNRLVMEATAYTSGFESTGKHPGHPAFGITASGLPAGREVVAVDPNVIPLGTRLYVEGFGEVVAGDTGSAIRGNRIDVYFEDVTDAINFGRQDLVVYILD